MKKFFRKNQGLLFYSSWFLLNLIQSSATGLFDDEAYYWVYSKFLDWGYFDHPPMIALLIKIGYAIVPNELGVRLLVAILSTAAIWLIEKLLRQKDQTLFYTIALSIAVLQLGGILAVPDIPLMFFTTLYFLAYRKFIKQPSLRNSILVGLCIAFLFYSKYHGLLVVTLALASNPKLLMKPLTYVAGLVALLLFAPHLYWQYQHGFPSVHYHLFERNATVYEISFTIEYIIGQLLLAGPLAGFILTWAAIRKKPSDETERAMKFTTIGFYLFFLLATLRGNVEGNWTFPAFIGLLVLSHQYLLKKEELRKWVYRLSAFTICLVFVARLYLLGAFPPIGLKDDEFLLNKEWTSEISRQANGLPVFFIDSYQRASKYWFYSGIPTYSLNTVEYRRNNFNLWKMEDSLQHKKMYAIFRGKQRNFFTDSFHTSKGLLRGRVIDKYFSFSRIFINCERRISGTANETVKLSLRIKSDQQTLDRIHPAFDSARIWMAVFSENSDEPVLLPTDLTLSKINSVNEVQDTYVTFRLPPKKYIVRFGITSCIPNRPSINSSVINLEIK